jgi:sulfite reductase (NADPH) flavoprotein alpha-component
MIINKNAPFLSKIVERYLLTKEGSTKQTYHIILDLKDSDIAFKTGDAIGVFGRNDPMLVEHIIKILGAKDSDLVIDPRSHVHMPLFEFLSTKANLSRLNSSLLKLIDLEHPLLSDKIALAQNDLLDLLPQAVEKNSLQSILETFAPMLPRFYSIASSLQTYPNEVHLTIALTNFLHKGQLRYGVATHFLCQLAIPKETLIPIYVQPTSHFTLPSNDATDLIMIGPGTGVAPFRAFMQERLARKASGKHWLFFGERNRSYDFFYEKEWTALTDRGFLILDAAFSRDQAEKHYVQHKLINKGALLWQWIEKGAYIFICGDADPMAKSVEAAFLEIFQTHGKLSLEGSKNYLKNLRHEKRYLADVY